MSNCNCVRGEFLCPVAEALWAAANAAYSAWANGLASSQRGWQDYLDARLKYDAHFKKEEL